MKKKRKEFVGWVRNDWSSIKTKINDEVILPIVFVKKKKCYKYYGYKPTKVFVLMEEV